jgi:hypothetical protein
MGVSKEVRQGLEAELGSLTYIVTKLRPTVESCEGRIREIREILREIPCETPYEIPCETRVEAN